MNKFTLLAALSLFCVNAFADGRIKDIDIAIGANINPTKIAGGTSAGFEVPLTFSPPLSRASSTISCVVATGSVAGCLSAADWTTFNAKQAALSFGNLTEVGTDGISVSGGTGAVVGAGTSFSQHISDATHNGYLSSANWSTFNGKQDAITTGTTSQYIKGDLSLGTFNTSIDSHLSGTAPISYSSGVIACAVASGSLSGCISSTDWNTFNGKQDALSLGNLTDAGTDGIVVTGGSGSVVGSGTSLAQHVSDSSHNGYLLSTDWSLFNAKQAAITTGTTSQYLKGDLSLGTFNTSVDSHLSGTAPIQYSSGVISCVAATGSVAGCLSAADWTTFNAKQAAGDYATSGTGDVTWSAHSGGGSVSTTIASSAVTNAKMANMAAHTYKGNNTSGSAAPLDLTISQVKSDLAIACSDLTNASASCSTDATNASNLSSGTVLAARMPALTGDVTTSAGAVATTIANSAVTNAKMANMADSTMKGRAVGAGSGAPTDLSTTQLNALVGAADLTLLNAIATEQTTDSSTGNIDTLSTSNITSIRLTGAAPALRGIANGAAGKLLLLSNVSGVSITVSNQNANPSAANRIITGTAADLTLTDTASLLLQYDGTTARWRVVGGSGGSASPLTTKGDLYTYSTTNDRLPVGSNNQILTPNSSASTGLNWVTALPTAAVPAFTGDVTNSAGSLATTIANNAVTNAKAAQMTNGTTKCRTTAGTGNSEDCTGPQETALLSAFVGDSGSGGTKGMVPAPNSSDGSSRKELTAGGSFTNPPLGAYTGINFATLNNSGNNWGNYSGDSFDAEGSVGSWVTYSGATLTGGSPNTTCTRNTSSPINGTGDLLMTVTTGATRANEGCSLLVNVPTAYRGQPMQVSFPYITTGTIAAGDFVITAYDVTNSAALAASTTVSAISGSAGTLNATFLPLSSAAQIRFAINIARSSTGSATVEWDDFRILPSLSQANVPMSDWVADSGIVTPSAGWGSVTSPSYFRRRVGDSMQIRGLFVAGTAASTNATVVLNGYTLDSSKLIANSAGVPLGTANRYAGSTTGIWTNTAGLLPFYDNSSTSTIFFAMSGASNVLTKAHGDEIIGASGNVIVFDVTIPISGWSSGGGTSPILSLSDWSASSAFTYNGMGTVSAQVEKVRRVGDSAHFRLSMTDGTAAASTVSIQLPTGYVIDTSKLSSSSSGTVVGSFVQATNGSALTIYPNNAAYVLFYDGSTSDRVFVAYRIDSGGFKKENGNSQLASSTPFVADFIIPIAGWTSTSSGTLTAPRSSVYLDTYAGYGSSNTKVPYFTNSSVTGPAMTLTTNDATSGARVTVNEAGVYCMSFSIDGATSGAAVAAIAKNATGSYTTSASSLSTALRRALQMSGAIVAIDSVASTSDCEPLVVGDIINPQTDAAVPNTSGRAHFTMTKVSN